MTKKARLYIGERRVSSTSKCWESLTATCKIVLRNLDSYMENFETRSPYLTQKLSCIKGFYVKPSTIKHIEENRTNCATLTLGIHLLIHL